MVQNRPQLAQGRAHDCRANTLLSHCIFSVMNLQGFLLPGEEMTLRLSIFVSHTTAAPLNLRMQKLSTLLIVHTLLGQDHFLSLSGEYGATFPTLPAETKVMTRVIPESSCFGTALSALARLPGPIRELKRVEDLLPEAQARNSSREFMKLMGWLMSHDVGVVVRPAVPAWHDCYGTMVVPFSPIYSSHQETKV
jgi:hypothetical protein